MAAAMATTSAVDALNSFAIRAGSTTFQFRQTNS